VGQQGRATALCQRREQQQLWWVQHRTAPHRTAQHRTAQLQSTKHCPPAHTASSQLAAPFDTTATPPPPATPPPGDSRYHGTTGLMHVESPRYENPLHDAFFSAAKAAGLPDNRDFNDWSRPQVRGGRGGPGGGGGQKGGGRGGRGYAAKRQWCRVTIVSAPPHPAAQGPAALMLAVLG
jgi:hypothetical protein